MVVSGISFWGKVREAVKLPQSIFLMKFRLLLILILASFLDYVLFSMAAKAARSEKEPYGLLFL